MSSFIKLPLAYLLWHFTTAWGDLWRLYTNILWFLWNLFSIRILSGTLLSPWHRLSEGRSKGSAGLIGKIIINTLTRIFGFFVRLGVILFGLCAILMFSVLSLCIFALWIVVPLIAVGLILYGLQGLFAAILAA